MTYLPLPESMNDNPSSRSQKVQAIYQILSSRINTGVWKAGTRIPSERELALEFNVSRAAVKQAIEFLEMKGLLDRSPNCRPTVHAAGSHKTRTAKSGRDQIAVWIPQSLEAPGAAAILQGIRQSLSAYRYSVVMGCPEGPNDLSELPFLESLTKTPSVAGAIILPSGNDTSRAYELLKKTNFPLVFVDREPNQSRDFDVVGTNNIQSAKLAVQHLIELGHRRIAMVTNHDLASSVRDRCDGYSLAMNAAGLSDFEVGTIKMPHGISEEASSRALEIVEQLMNQPDRPTAVFAVNDQCALHLFDAAKTVGYSIPDDLSLVGFDWSLRWVPSGGHITTICQHFADIGRIAVDRLLEKIGSHEEQVPRQILVEGTLVYKGSTTSILPQLSLKT